MARFAGYGHSRLSVIAEAEGYLSNGSVQVTDTKYYEIQADEACQWLRATGFPQYAHMFDEGMFPVDICDVQKDHLFLDKDSLESVIRRLNILNTCSVMKIDAQPSKKAPEESDEEDHCALSSNWEYQKSIRRWSRKLDPEGNVTVIEADSNLQPSSSHDSLLGEDSGSHTDDSPELLAKMPHSTTHPPAHRAGTSHHQTVHFQVEADSPAPAVVEGSRGVVVEVPPDSHVSSPISPKLRRTRSERLKCAIKKVEGLKKKPKKSTFAGRNIVEISGPVVSDQESMQAKLQRLNCVDIPGAGSGGGGGVVGVRGTTPTSPLTPTPAPAPAPHLPPPHQESTPTSNRLAHSGGGGKQSSLSSSLTPSSSFLSPIPPVSGSSSRSRTGGGMDQSVSSSSSSSVTGDVSSLSEYYTAHSQLLASFQEAGQPPQHHHHHHPPSSSSRKNSDSSSLLEIFMLPQDHKPGSFPRLLKNGYIDTLTPTFPPPPPPAPSHPYQQPPSVNVLGSSAPSRVSVYDNLGPGSPLHALNITPSSPSSRHSQVLRSLSASSGPALDHNSQSSELDMSTFAGMVRSRSASAATSLEREQAPSSDGTRRGSESLTGFSPASCRRWKEGEEEDEDRVVSERKLSAGMEELDAMLQNLYREINSLGSDLSSSSSARDQEDGDGGSRGHTPLGGGRISHSSSASTITGSVISGGGGDGHNVSFSTADHNGGHLLTGSLQEDSLSTTSSQQRTAQTTVGGDSVDLSTSPGGEVDESLEGEEVEGEDLSSQDSSEEIEGSADETLERIILEAHERRDSGVGSSLTRDSRERTRKKKIRWESFQKSHRPSRASRELQIGGLSVCQLLPLRQLSLLKLTSVMEKYSPTNRSQWSWSVPRFMRRNKAPQFSDKNVFGVPFTVMLQRTGQPLPQCVLLAMRYLRKTCHEAIGIFRKSGVRSRIQKLRDMVEACPDTVNFDELQPYDVADLLKQYFRELPECLLTSKLSDTFRSIFSHVPIPQRLEALQTAVVLLPEENREVLHCLLLFLGDIAKQADKHQMNASNLAVCFAPSLFNFLGCHGTNSPKRQRRGLGVPEQRELLEQKAVHECFTYMITESKKLFMVPPSMYSRLHLSTLSNMEPVHLDEFYAKGKTPGPDFRAFGEEHIQFLLKEAHDKNRGWAPVSVGVSNIEVMQRKPQDGHPLRQWKLSVEIEAPPVEVLDRIIKERHKFDDDMLSWNVVQRLEKHCDVLHYVLNSMAPHPPRHFMVIRYWRCDLANGACALVTKSVEHSGWQGAGDKDDDYDQAVRAVELGSFYLFEPCGSGRSRLTFITRTDLRGRCPEWYNRVYGHVSAIYVDKLRDSFKQDADGPETKV